ncbi:NUDIX hydrolase [Alloscardovia theropitheci]|uniref:NUDIX hydrolase n=1 Tax=Alloscardovia theropitheci TaxID=2496842 RepID=A0A4R0QSM7_9BIFI|nr:NUDIX hydrolase [Alloscardovia theropitheci]TCD54155.1 NUDIX hydrolase [Alloscardovia theropitheci]
MNSPYDISHNNISRDDNCDVGNSNENSTVESTAIGRNTRGSIPLEEISRSEVYREVGGADFAVTEIRTRVKATGEYAQFNVVNVKNGAIGTICVVRSQDGKFLLGNHWRVSVSQFEWEFPRGMGEEGETIEQTAIRELEEETGFTRADIANKTVMSDSSDVLSKSDKDVSQDIRVLQYFYPDTGLQSIKVAIVEIVLNKTTQELTQSSQGRLIGSIPDEAQGLKNERGLGDNSSNRSSSYPTEHFAQYSGDWELSGGKRWVGCDELDSMIRSGQLADGMTLAAYAVWKANNQK